MFADYRKLVLRCYESKRAENKLSLRLTNPTPAKLKEESLDIFSKRYNRKDQSTLDAFFGAETDDEERAKAIKRCDRDKFRPLINFLNSETKNPDDRIIELLAWLIDFEPRPFEFGRRYDVEDAKGYADEIENGEHKGTDAKDTQPGTAVATTATTDTKPYEMAQIPADKKKSDIKIKVAFAAIIILIVSGAGMYWLQSNKSEGFFASSLPSEACMYWAGDHYEQCSCSEQHGEALVIAMDTFALTHLKKIDRPDTITQNAIGSVWYIKTNGTIEYFTAGGKYPADPKRKLNPITAYMIRQHILKQP